MFSILIPTLNNLNYLKLCIKSIKQFSSHKNEILVHVSEDNDHSTRNYLDNINIKYSYTSNNVGLCTAINTVAKKATYSYLIYSHDDMYFCPNWDKSLLYEINKIGNNDFYISGSMIEPNSGHIKFDCGLTFDSFNEEKLLKNLSNLNTPDHQGSHFAPHCVHRDIWDKVGGFSEEFNPGIASDPDFNMKLWNCGVRVFKGLNKFKVYHFGSITTRKNSLIKKNKGDITFLKKWGFTTKFFKRYYLRSNTFYTEPLKEPNRNFLYYIDLLKCKIKFLYIKIFFN
jgi:glycosyltransferase involved in cell wall biosynthesis